MPAQRKASEPTPIKKVIKAKKKPARKTAGKKAVPEKKPLRPFQTKIRTKLAYSTKKSTSKKKHTLTEAIFEKHFFCIITKAI